MISIRGRQLTYASNNVHRFSFPGSKIDRTFVDGFYSFLTFMAWVSISEY